MSSSASKQVHVACGQIVCATGNPTANIDQIIALAQQASEQGARIILYGEAAITGYVMNDDILATAIRQDGPEAERLLQAAANHNIVLAAGTLEVSDLGHHVSHFIAFPDGELIAQRKANLTPKERAANLIPGPEEREIFEVDGVTMAVCICADSGIPDIDGRLAERGCQVYLGPSAGGGGRQFMHHAPDLENRELRKKYLDSMSKVCYVPTVLDGTVRHRMAKVCVNLSGDDGVDNYHPGHSFIVDAYGKLLALIPGEYVVEYLRPQLIHGVIAVSEPRRPVEETAWEG